MTAWRRPPSPVDLDIRRPLLRLAFVVILCACAEQGSGPAPNSQSPNAPTAPAAKETPVAEAEPAPAEPAEAPTATQALPGGMMVARAARPDPALAADSGPGNATARWGAGPEIDARSPWRSIGGDGIHERRGGAVGLLQEPRAAFRTLPRANSGNLVDWVAALDTGTIRPRSRVGIAGEMEVLDLDIRFSDTKNMPYVTFPHRAHTQWLSCSNCHDWLFKAKTGSSDISMGQIARGQACGLCHGKVAFPPTECFRCHNGPRPTG